MRHHGLKAVVCSALDFWMLGNDLGLKAEVFNVPDIRRIPCARQPIKNSPLYNAPRSVIRDCHDVDLLPNTTAEDCGDLFEGLKDEPSQREYQPQ